MPILVVLEVTWLLHDSLPQLLLAHGAPLFVQNVAGQTPCDVAWEAKQLIIAKQLESKMVLTVCLIPRPLPETTSSLLNLTYRVWYVTYSLLAFARLSVPCDTPIMMCVIHGGGEDARTVVHMMRGAMRHPLLGFVWSSSSTGES